MNKTLQTIALLACCQLVQAAPTAAKNNPATITAAAEQNDAWMVRLIAWADEFQIPAQDLPRDQNALRHLQELNLNRLDYIDNGKLPKITYLPPEIGQLQQLQRLYLDANQLRALPATIGKLQQLQVLSLSDNQLRTLPAEISQLQQLQGLYLLRNQLTALPDDIGKLQQLHTLFLDENPLTALPASFTRLHKLRNFNYDPSLQLTPEQVQFLDAER